MLSIAVVKALAKEILIGREVSSSWDEWGFLVAAGLWLPWWTRLQEKQEKRGQVFADARQDGLTQRHEMTRCQAAARMPRLIRSRVLLESRI